MADSSSGKPNLLDEVRNTIRLKHYSIRTEEAYSNWVRRFVLFHGKRHPKFMGSVEISAFLTHLAVEGLDSVSGTVSGLPFLCAFSVRSVSSVAKNLQNDREVDLWEKSK